MKVINIVKDRISRGIPVMSVEIIPPRNGEILSKTLKKVESLLEVSPDFVSITRGAGGSLRGGTVPIAYLIKTKLGIETVAHLTCIDTSIEELENLLIDHHYLGLENILALRGDPPRDAPAQYKDGKGFNYHKYAKGLVQQLISMNRGEYLARPSDKKKGIVKDGRRFRSGNPCNFCILVAGHPEGHPECPDPDRTLQHLKEKVDQGADLIITQMVFSAKTYAEFVKKAREIGIKKPVIPGVRPITKARQIAHIESFFGVTVTERFKEGLKGLAKSDARRKGVEMTLELCRELLDAGAPGVHFYIMNDVKIGGELITRLRDSI